MVAVPSDLLLMDTSMPHGIVAYACNGAVVAEEHLIESRRHGEQLANVLGSVLAKAQKSFSDMNGIVIGTGPGSFVGVRVAMATGKGIAVAQQIPIWGVSTLAALAFGAKEQSTGSVLALIDARRGQGYACHYDFSEMGSVSSEPEAVDPDELPAMCRKASLIVGNGLFLLDGVPKQKVIRLEQRGPSGEGLLNAFKKRCINSWPEDEKFSLVPDYVRAPDAKAPAIAPNYSVVS